MKKTAKTVRHLTSAEKQELVSKYLDKHQLKYGQMITGRDILVWNGYEIEKSKDSLCQAYLDEDFEEMGIAISNIAETQFKRRGFAADKRRKKDAVTTSGAKSTHFGSQSVYTNWPWTHYFKGSEAVKYAERSMKGDHRGEICQEFMLKNMIESRKQGERFLDMVSDMASRQKGQNDTELTPQFELFKEALNEDMDGMKAEARRMQPSNYNG